MSNFSSQRESFSNKSSRDCFSRAADGQGSASSRPKYVHPVARDIKEKFPFIRDPEGVKELKFSRMNHLKNIIADMGTYIEDPEMHESLSELDLYQFKFDIHTCLHGLTYGKIGETPDSDPHHEGQAVHIETLYAFIEQSIKNRLNPKTDINQKPDNTPE